MEKRALAAVAAVLLFLLAGPQLFAEYDRQLVVGLMRDNVSQLGRLNTAAQAGDYYDAALALVKLAENAKALQAVSPPRGSKALWDRIHGEVIKAAFRGVGACGSEDGARLSAAIQEIRSLQQQGHNTFR